MTRYRVQFDLSKEDLEELMEIAKEEAEKPMQLAKKILVKYIKENRRDSRQLKLGLR